MIGETIFQYLIEKALDNAGKFLKERRLKFRTTANDLEHAVSAHADQILKWSEEITFKDISKAKRISQIFIDVDILLIPQRNHLSKSEIVDQISSRNIFSEVKNHIVILGQPGAGKTTLMKFICRSTLLNEDYYPGEFKIPILIRLREYNTRFQEKSSKHPLVDILFETLGLSLENRNQEITDDELALGKERLLFPILEELKAVIILDGYDEVSSQEGKDKVFQNFYRLVLNLSNSRVVLTSRSSDFNYSLERLDVLEIAPLNKKQIYSFASKWLQDQEKVTNFIYGLENSPFGDTAIRPLTLAHLCAIYDRSGKIPDKPKTVYKKIVNLLLEEWDEQRGVKRLSRYGSFETDRKKEFLCRLASEITLKYKSSVFSEDTLKAIYKNICVDFDLAPKEINLVINEIETHTGLVLQVGYQEYEFAHKSIHEYLCAEFLVRLPSMPSSYMIATFPNELAIAVTISSNPSQYFCELINIFYSVNVDNKFVTIFINRLILEKPDFNTSQEVSFALLLLYNLFRTEEHGQLKLFEYDYLTSQFERFVDLIFKRNEMMNLFEYYEIIDKKYTENSDVIFYLKKTTEKVYHGMYRLPDFLFAKNTILKGIMSR